MKQNHCAFVDKGLRLKMYDKGPKQLYASTKPCCHLSHTLVPQKISNFQKLDNPATIMDSIGLTYFRDYFDQNEDLHPACLACKNYEDKGIESPREKYNRLEEKYIKYDISKLDVVLGNTCNLACPFCASASSSLIDKLSNNLDINNRPQNWTPLANNHAPGTVYTSDVVAEILKNYKVHTLKLVGGEPFLAENWSKIAEAIDKGYCKDLKLEVTTNGTIINNEILSRLAKTRSARIMISVDSIGSNYEFIRWPHTWKKIEKNLNFLKNNQVDNVKIAIDNLVNIFNFEFLPEIEEYFWNTKRVGYSCEIKPATSLMNYQNLPEHIINKVKNRLRNDDLRNTLVSGNNNYSKEQLRHEFIVLLAQRKMKAEDVIGPLTREYLEL